MAWCLIKSEEKKFREALISGEIDPFKLADMTSEGRRTLFEKYVDPENAININSLYESKLLLKNQVTGFENWAKRTLGMKSQVKRDLLTRIERLDKVLDPKDLQSFKEDLARTRLGLNITFEEAKNINRLSKKRTEARDKWQKKIDNNIAWNDDPHATRKEWINDKDRIKYGVTQVALENYVNGLKLEARKISFKESPALATLDAIGKIPSVFKSLMASFDNSFFGRQGIKNLYGSMGQKRIWTNGVVKSFKDIGAELRAKKIKGLTAMDLVRADIYSRPNSLNGKYKAGGYRLDVLSEEAFPSSLPEKIPGLGRLFRASETAFNGGALRMRADLADMYISRMEKQGINTLDPNEARGVGHMVGSLTGRGSLGKLEPVGREINVLMFSGRFLKANLDTLTAHSFDPKATKYTKSEARRNLLSIIAHIAGILLIAKILKPDSVDEDPRSTNFGRIKIFGHWTDITGGMRTLTTLASRIVPTRRNGELGQWSKSSTGRWVNLHKSRFGQGDWMDTVMSALLFNRLSPIARVVYDAGRGEMFGGEPFDIKKSIVNSTTPLSIQQVLQAKDDGFAPALAVTLSELVGLSVGGYKYKSYWEKSTSKEMINFKKQVGEEKFGQANDAYNRAYNAWVEEVIKDPKYKKLSDKGKDKLKTDARKAIKDKILKEYGYRKKKSIKTIEERQEKKIQKTLLPKVSGLIKDANNILGKINVIPEALAAEHGKKIVKNISIKGNTVYTTYRDGSKKTRSLSSYQKGGVLAGLGKIFNDVGTSLGLRELHVSEALQYKTKKEVISELAKYKEDVLNNIPQPKAGPTISIPKKKILPSSKKRVKQVSKNIKEAFGDDWVNASRVLKHTDKNGRVKGENINFTSRQKKGERWKDYNYKENKNGKVTDYSEGNRKYIYNQFSKKREWSEDRGLFRINNETFYTYLGGKKERAEMYRAGIIPKEHLNWKGLDGEKAKEYYKLMYNPVLNAKMAHIIYMKQGWCAWFAAPADLCPKNE